MENYHIYIIFACIFFVLAIHTNRLLIKNEILKKEYQDLHKENRDLINKLHDVLHKPKKSLKLGHHYVALERLKQLAKHSIAGDVKYNNGYQLIRATIGILHNVPDDKIHIYAPDYLPSGWDLERWTKLLRKPLIERLAIAGAWMCAEIDRTNPNILIDEKISD